MTPLSLRSIASDARRIWIRDFRSLTILAAVLELPIVVVELALSLGTGINIRGPQTFTINAATLLLAFYGGVSHHFVAGLLEKLVASERRGGQRPTLRGIFHDLPWWRLIVGDVILMLLTVAGLAMLVIPGLLVITYFSIALPLINLERRSVWASFARSYRLVNGHFWRVLFLSSAVLIIPEVIIALVADVVHHLSENELVGAIGHAVPATILMPIAALPLVVLAFELVDRDKATLVAA